MLGKVTENKYKIENAELTQQLTTTTQTISGLESIIEQSKSSSKKQEVSPVVTVETTEFKDEMMNYVKSIKIYNTNLAVVDIDLTSTGICLKN